MRSIDTEEQQWLFSRVVVDDVTGCWLWTLALNAQGYGKLGHQQPLGKKYGKRGIHQLSHIMFNGPIPEGHMIRHKCRQRHCCNPDHLETGTSKDNHADMKRDGTKFVAEGTDSHYAKLTEAAVIEIRRLYKAGSVTYAALADKFNLTASAISLIVNRKTWKHI